MPRPKFIDLRPQAVRQRAQDADMGFYRRAAWRSLRKRFLAENPLCARCLAERDETVPATTAHHVIERLADPSRALDPTNLEALCGPCHAKHHGGPNGGPMMAHGST